MPTCFSAMLVCVGVCPMERRILPFVDAMGNAMQHLPSCSSQRAFASPRPIALSTQNYQSYVSPCQRSCLFCWLHPLRKDKRVARSTFQHELCVRLRLTVRSNGQTRLSVDTNEPSTNARRIHCLSDQLLVGH